MPIKKRSRGNFNAGVFCFLALLFGLSGLAHEGRINPEQRRAIRERLQSRGCLDGLSGLAPTTRSRGTAGRTRSLETNRDSSALPPAVEQYDNYFSQVIPVEFELPYGQNTDLPSQMFFKLDPYEGKEKIDVQKELGIRFDPEGGPAYSPTWMEAAKKYRSALQRRGIDPQETFVPALVLYKSGAGGKREYLFVDPLSEPFPADMASWKVLDKDVQFNIPFAAIAAAMREGKFPLLDAVHDVSHFVSFLRFPEFAKAVRAQLAQVDLTTVTPGFKAREYWLTEALSLPDPLGRVANQEFLRGFHRPLEVREVGTIEKELSQLSEAALVDYSLKIARHLESQLRDVSGGNSSSAEKWYYLSEAFGMKGEDLLHEDISRSSPWKPSLALAKIYFENAPVSLHANPKAISNETATFNFNTFGTAQKLLALSMKEGRLDGTNKAEALRQLLKFTSRTEHVLTVPPFTYQEWASSLLQARLPHEDPRAKLLGAVFPNETVSNYYFGLGSQRPKPNSK